MKKLCSILIACYQGGEAIELCIKSILKRTNHIRYEIIVFDSSGRNSQEREYLEKQKKKGIIKLITRENKTSHSDAWQILFDKSDSPWVCYLHSDIEILSSDWLYDLLKEMRGQKDLGFAKFEAASLTYSLHWSAPCFHTKCILLNTQLYKLIRSRNDWREAFADISELKDYFSPEAFYVLPPPKHNKIFCEAGSGFAENVLFYNKHKLIMHAFDEEWFKKRFKHYETLSHPEHDIGALRGQKLKRNQIHERLIKLRRQQAQEIVEETAK